MGNRIGPLTMALTLLVLWGCGTHEGNAPETGRWSDDMRSSHHEASGSAGAVRKSADHDVQARSPTTGSARVRRPGAGVHLPDERPLLDWARGTLAGETAGRMLQSDDFDDVVRSLAEDMAIDRDAMDMAKFYDTQIAEQLPEHAAMGDIACGTSICVGSVRDGEIGSLGEAWALDFSTSEHTPHHSFIYTQIALDARNVETRFVIGTDPAYDGVTFPAPRPGID